MIESNKRVCKNCRLLKNRIQQGMFDARNKKWVDENAWTWNGNLCPQCELERVRNKMAEKRSKKNV